MIWNAHGEVRKQKYSFRKVDNMDRIRNPSAVDYTRFAENVRSPEILYGLSDEVRFCKTCVVSNQRPNSFVEYIHTRSSRRRPSISTGAACATPVILRNRRGPARRFGSQSMVLSVEAKRTGSDNGRERTGLEAIEWVKRGVSMGAGEALLTSVDHEGTRKGLDIALVKILRRFRAR